MARYRALFPLRTEASADGLRVHSPRSLHLLRGGLGIAMSPVVAGLVMLAVFLTVNDAELGAMVGGCVGGCFVVLGIVLLSFSGPLSRRTEVSIDRASIRRARDGATASTAAIALVRVRKREGLSTFHVLELVARDGSTFVVNDRLPMMASDLATLAGDCAAWLRVPCEVPTAGVQALNEKHAAALCYLPVQGVFLFASLWFIVTDRRPFVRFAARQSLLHFAFSSVALIAVLVVGGLPVLLTEGSEGPVRVATVICFAFVLVAYLVWNVGAHMYACAEAFKGRAWVMPWLRWVVKPLV